MRLITPTERIALKTAYDQGSEYGQSVGIELGQSKGRSEGIELGRSEGIELGRSQGIELGRSEGIELGWIEATREILLMLGEERLGACPPDCRSRIETISSRELLLQLRRRLESVESWEELPIP